MKPNKHCAIALVICVILTACTSLERETRLKIKEYTQAIKHATNDNARAEAYLNRGYVTLWRKGTL